MSFAERVAPPSHHADGDPRRRPAPHAHEWGDHWVASLARQAHNRAQRPALVFEGTVSTWHELYQRVLSGADALAARGVRRGDRVAILMGNRPRFLEAVLAANAIGAIAVPVNFRLSAPEISFILNDCGAVAVVVDEERLAIVQKARAGAPDVGVVFSARCGSSRHADVVDWDECAAGGGEHDLPSMIDDSEPALILYTSGTTGRPKGAVLSHRNINSMAHTMVRHFGLNREDDVSLYASPMFHVGLICIFGPMIAVGTATVITPSGNFDADEVLRLVQTHRVSHAFLVPSQWQEIVDSPDVSTRADSLRVTCWSAAPATERLLTRMLEAFPHAVNMSTFGQTETAGVTTFLGGDDALSKLGSVGKPVAAVAVRIVDDSMQDVGPGEIGEIVYRGPSVMDRYWNLPTETAEAFRGGWFHSGDLVRKDEDGFLYVVGRLKDLIISGGENIYSAEVESVLDQHPKVREVAVVGAAHEKWGESPVAVVVAADPAQPPTLDELTMLCRKRLASYKKPTRLVVVDSLPRNAVGKVVKSELRELL